MAVLLTVTHFLCLAVGIYGGIRLGLDIRSRRKKALRRRVDTVKELAEGRARA